ncbi:hypothetical protein VTO42DRAFT_5330 [Malbranchea cinnamomea]
MRDESCQKNFGNRFELMEKPETGMTSHRSACIQSKSMMVLWTAYRVLGRRSTVVPLREPFSRTGPTVRLFETEDLAASLDPSRSPIHCFLFFLFFYCSFSLEVCLCGGFDVAVSIRRETGDRPACSGRPSRVHPSPRPPHFDFPTTPNQSKTTCLLRRSLPRILIGLVAQCLFLSLFFFPFFLCFTEYFLRQFSPCPLSPILLDLLIHPFLFFVA